MKPHADFVAPHVLADLPPQTPIAVALSGGADSVALLHMLVQTGCALHAIHVHHGIRGAEADRDAAFCRALAKKWNVPITVLTRNVPQLAREQGESIETVARQARYDAIGAYMRENDLCVLATAHHADDQLETVLQHLLRGAGLNGLCGIPACRPLFEGAVVVRPLLLVPKRDILAYCTAHGLDFVNDSTNAERCCTRNRLRLDVLPALNGLQPQAARLVARCARNLAEDEAYLTEKADEFLAREGREPSIAALDALPRPIFVRVMRALLPQAPAEVHLDALRGLVHTARPHAALSLPPHTVARIEHGCLVLTEDGDTPTPDYELALTEGENPIPAIEGLAVLLRGAAPLAYTPKQSYPHSICIRFSSAAVQGELCVRPRRAGDRIRQGGMHKAVRKLPELAALTPSLRARMPLLVDDEGVLAVPFSRLRDGAARDPDTTVFLFFN
ncbi:MAG: tRNA lysidine(34) synthetase TilS [Clostridia bacterium]|nr:tRNA lysidine(34) synthetase TilS [Clostridia bacterium]